MRITPLEVKHQAFPKGVRGYRPEDVHGFLEMVAVDLESLLNERLSLESRVASLTSQVDKFQNLERSLRDAMLLASDAKDVIERKGVTIVAKAHEQAERLITDAEAREHEVVASIRTHRDELLTEVDSLERQHRHMLARMRDMSTEQLALVASYDRAEPAQPADAEESTAGQIVSLASPKGSNGNSRDSTQGAEASVRGINSQE